MPPPSLAAFQAPAAWIGTKARLGAEQAAYYSIEPLHKTLRDLTCPELLNAGSPRLTVGAANVRTGEMHYFDSRKTPLSVRHIMASGALPPAFPAIRIDGELYWDGGVLSNTPVEAVFDDNPRRSALIFAVHMWGPNGPEPDSIWSVLGRQKDLQYVSRAVSHIRRQKQIHKLRHIIAELEQKLPAEARADPEIAAMAAHGCTTRMHVVRLLAPPLAGDDHSKDIDFSAKGIGARWQAGYADTKHALTEMPWSQEFDRTEGFILHEAHAGRVMARGNIRGTLSVESS
jgi:NTE family protein